ncbi:MAG: triose-phosphate isomerase [Patescibacteria group bacterium]|nr:triose-phosphate isomerase [Patescibacteria group bacterium]
MSKKLVIANWKMNPTTLKETNSLISGFLKYKFKKSNLIICPPFVFIPHIKNKISKSKKIFLGAQDAFYENKGSSTGEISPKMLVDLKVEYVILGHSERRALGESNELINKKLLLALKNKLNPILCVGENKRDTDGFYLSYVKKQLHKCLKGVSKSKMKNVIIAYEPVWAVGSDNEATSAEFTEMNIFIKKIISDIYDPKTAYSIKIIYGGSVHPKNVKSFEDADGFLVGRDSLNVDKFEKILLNIDEIN